MAIIAGGMAACGGAIKQGTETASDSTANSASADTVPAYTVLNLPMVSLENYKTDADGFINLFDGKSLTGWRGYGKDTVPELWTVEDGALKFKGREGANEKKDGGDIVFGHKFKNFELEVEWKVAKGANSGIFYLGQEIKGQPIYISCPEYQVLDNENHPDAKLGENGNRKSASLYDMIPANPQNSKPFGQWNLAKISVQNGKVTHYQNGEKVLEYQLWTPEWTALLQKSKFSKEKWPLAFELLSNCGGAEHEGLIGFQDHGNEVWFRKIRVHIL
ncbi:protein of unknown function [bacterium A37T11]|nr:protein of unknown function [bacterium A37T11]